MRNWQLSWWIFYLLIKNNSPTHLKFMKSFFFLANFFQSMTILPFLVDCSSANFYIILKISLEECLMKNILLHVILIFYITNVFSHLEYSYWSVVFFLAKEIGLFWKEGWFSTYRVPNKLYSLHNFRKHNAFVLQVSQYELVFRGLKLGGFSALHVGKWAECITFNFRSIFRI